MTAETCPFCGKCEPVRTSNQHAIAISDQRPISRGHTLIVARLHVPTIFDLPLSDYVGCFELVRETKDLVAKEYGAESFHVVVNCGRRPIRLCFTRTFILYRDTRAWTYPLPANHGLKWSDIHNRRTGLP